MVKASSYGLRPRHGRKAFTLVELAIVIAIVGAVLGAVFVASSAVRYKNMVNQASDELGITAANIRSLYAGYGIPSGLSACPPGFGTLIQYQVYPKEMWSPTTVGIVNNPWNVNSTTNTVEAALCAGSVTEFAIRYTEIPDNACADLLIRNSLPGRDTGLVQVNVNSTMVGQANTGSASSATPLPIAPVDASTACASATNTIDWYYVLNN